jgi:hypothetical protein
MTRDTGIIRPQQDIWGQALLSTSGTVSYMFSPSKNYDAWLNDAKNPMKATPEPVTFQDHPDKPVDCYFTYMKLGTF